MAASTLIGADVVGGALGPGEAVEVEQWHAEAHAGGTQRRAGVDGDRAALEVVIPGHGAGVVHEEPADLGLVGGRGARLMAEPKAKFGAVVLTELLPKNP